MSKLATFEQSYLNSMETIIRYKEDEDIGKYINWLLKTTINPYSYLENNIALSEYSAEGFAYLSGLIFMALVDDGSICFPVIDDQPCIRFCDRYEFIVPKRKDYSFENGKFEDTLVDSDIRWLDSFDDFIIEIEKYETSNLKQYFYEMVYDDGIDYAVKHYGNKEFFNKAWIDNDPDEETLEKLKPWFTLVDFKRSRKQ